MSYTRYAGSAAGVKDLTPITKLEVVALTSDHNGQAGTGRQAFGNCRGCRFDLFACRVFNSDVVDARVEPGVWAPIPRPLNNRYSGKLSTYSLMLVHNRGLY